MMHVAVRVVMIDDDGVERDVHEIARLARDRLSPETLGLSLSEAKAITGGIQQVVSRSQVETWQAAQRTCPECGLRRGLKGRHAIVFRTVFGVLRLAGERLRSCPCNPGPAGSVSPLSRLFPERSSPELQFVETKFASLISYGLTVKLMSELLPLDKSVGAEQVRRALFRVAETHESDLAEKLAGSSADAGAPAATPPDGPLFVGMDGGYVRGRDKNWFEAVVGKSIVSFHRDGRPPDPSGRCFAFVQTVDAKPRTRLVDSLLKHGLAPTQQVIFMSDGADTLRRLQKHIAPEAEHVLDWFHVTMRLTVLKQMIKGAWADEAMVAEKHAALEKIKWMLWHGNSSEALHDIGWMQCDVDFDLREGAESAPLRKLETTVGEFWTYINNNMAYMVNYGERFRGKERISTGFVESAVNQVIDKRFDKRQSMRWTPKGAHLLLQTRTHVLNGDLDDLLRRKYPAFRTSEKSESAPVLG